YTAGSDGGSQWFGASCVVDINNSSFVNNSSGGDGGGVFCQYGCSLDVNDSSFTGNLADGYYGSGGGIYWDYQGTVAISNSKFVDNESTFGGGLYWYGEDSNVAISNCIIKDNAAADHGGGLYWSKGAPKIKGCTIIGNMSEGPFVSPDGGGLYGGGGGIFSWSSDATIEDCYISRNLTLGSGGGVYFGGDTGSPTLRNCLVGENSALLNGGGVVSYWLARPTISNCTIVDNIAYDPAKPTQRKGGGLACSYESKTVLIDSILWGNTAAIGSEIAIGSVNEPNLMQWPA
ncbi:unnamed protein product, partial [marine sediment metagenome]